MEFTLYHYWRSSSSWRVRWALELKGLKAKMVPVNLLDGESDREPHLSRHPLGYVPVLTVNGRNMIESAAIVEWLEENYPSPRLYPGDSFNRAHIRALVEIINADTQPIQNLNVVDYHSTDAAEKKRWQQHFIRRGLAAFEKISTARAGRFSVGDQITAADLYLVPQCYNAVRFDVALSEFPLIERIYNEAMKTPECHAAAPERYHDQRN